MGCLVLLYYCGVSWVARESRERVVVLRVVGEGGRERRTKEKEMRKFFLFCVLFTG